MTASQDALLLASGSLNNELTLTQQNLVVTQAIMAQLRANEKELKTKLQQTAEEKQKLITADAELIQDRDLAKNTIVKLAATKEDLSKINAELETKLKGVLETVSELTTSKEEYTSKMREMSREKNDVITLKADLEMQYNVAKISNADLTVTQNELQSKLAQSAKENINLKAELKKKTKENKDASIEVDTVLMYYLNSQETIKKLTASQKNATKSQRNELEETVERHVEEKREMKSDLHETKAAKSRFDFDVRDESDSERNMVPGNACIRKLSPVSLGAPTTGRERRFNVPGTLPMVKKFRKFASPEGGHGQNRITPEKRYRRFQEPSTNVSNGQTQSRIRARSPRPEDPFAMTE